MNRRMLTLCYCFIAITATSQNAQPLFTEFSDPDTLRPWKTHTIVDTTGVRVQTGISRTHISPYGLTMVLDSLMVGHYPLIIYPPEKHPDHVPFLFNLNSSEQLPYTGKNNVMMFGWNLGIGGSNLVPGRPGIGFSLESNYHPSGDANTTWVESHEFYIKPNGEQVRLKSYTISVPPASEFIDLYHTTDNFHIRTEDLFDYFTVHREKSSGSAIMNFESSGDVGVIFGRTDYPQSIQFQVTSDRVNIIGKSKILAFQPPTELYLDAGAVGGINTGYGLNVGSGINAIGELGDKPVEYSFFANNVSANDNTAIMSIGAYSAPFSGKRYSLIAYNNGIVTINKDWQQFSGTAGMEVGRKNGAKTPLKLDDLPKYASNEEALTDGLEPGCLYIRTGHGLDVVVAGGNTRTAPDITRQ